MKADSDGQTQQGVLDADLSTNGNTHLEADHISVALHLDIEEGAGPPTQPSPRSPGSTPPSGRSPSYDAAISRARNPKRSENSRVRLALNCTLSPGSSARPSPQMNEPALSPAAECTNSEAAADDDAEAAADAEGAEAAFALTRILRESQGGAGVLAEGPGAASGEGLEVVDRAGALPYARAQSSPVVVGEAGRSGSCSGRAGVYGLRSQSLVFDSSQRPSMRRVSLPAAEKEKREIESYERTLSKLRISATPNAISKEDVSHPPAQYPARPRHPAPRAALARSCVSAWLPI